MNGARPQPFPRRAPTHTFWPASRRPDPPPAPKPARPDEQKDDEQAGDEPGYGHGV